MIIPNNTNNKLKFLEIRNMIVKWSPEEDKVYFFDWVTQNEGMNDVDAYAYMKQMMKTNGKARNRSYYKKRGIEV